MNPRVSQISLLRHRLSGKTFKMLNILEDCQMTIDWMGVEMARRRGNA